MKDSRMLPDWLRLVIQRKSHVWTFQMKNRTNQLLQAYIYFLLKWRLIWKITDAHRRLFICISGLGRIQRMLRKILHIQIPGKQKCMNAAVSYCHYSGKLQETEAYILYCISFSGSGSTHNKGGRRREHPWVEKSQIIRPWPGYASPSWIAALLWGDNTFRESLCDKWLWKLLASVPYDYQI